MQSCRDCGEIKDAAEFKVGRQCNECRSDYQREWRLANLAVKAEHNRKDRLRHPNRNAARRAVRKAIYEGKLRRGKCVVCGTDKEVQGHHGEGYDEANHLNVTWLCRHHHATYHTMERRIKRALAKEEA